MRNERRPKTEERIESKTLILVRYRPRRRDWSKLTQFVGARATYDANRQRPKPSVNTAAFFVTSVVQPRRLITQSTGVGYE